MDDQLCFRHLQISIEVDKPLEESEDCESDEGVVNSPERGKLGCTISGNQRSAIVQSISEIHDVRSTCPKATSWRLLDHLDSGLYAMYLIPF